MRIIEKCWVDINAGYHAVLSLETQLKTDWKRAIQVAQRRADLAIKSRLRRGRNIAGIAFFTLLFICVLLWVARSYFPENRFQLWLYFCVLTLPGLISGAFFLFYLGKSFSQTAEDAQPSMNLMGQWWKTLMPKDYVRQKSGDEGEIDFLHSLSFLDNRYVAVWGLLTSVRVISDTDVLLLGPSGIWVFEVKSWKGTVSKRDGVWSRVVQGEKLTYSKSPDDQWLDQKNEITKTIKIRIPSKAWLAEIIQGGVVFTNPKVEFGQIDGYTASYGTPGAWHKRLKSAQPIKGFGMEERLQVLDALIAYANLHERQVINVLSAATAARDLYDDTSVTLREYVMARVKG